MSHQHSEPRRRIFVHVSRTYFQGSRSGVPRVVRKIVEAFEARADIETICFVFEAGRFFCVPSSGLKEYEKTADMLRRAYRKSGLLALDLVPVKVLVRAVWALFCALRLRLRAVPLSRVPDFQPDDMILLLDHCFDEMLFAVLEKRRNGARIAGVVYDMFNFRYADIFTQDGGQAFSRDFARFVVLCDRLICISKTTADGLGAYLVRHNIAKSVSHFYLGADFRGEMHQARSGGAVPAILSVSALNPQKNYVFALALCDKLWAQGLRFSYVIVGEPTAHTGRLMSDIRNHPRYGLDLFHYDRVEDGELAVLYQKADCLLSTSLDEGFGLPAMEAFRHGVPVACSDIPVYRETCGDKAVFLPLDNIESSAALLRQALENPRPVNGMPPGLRTWRESADWLLREIA